MGWFWASNPETSRPVASRSSTEKAPPPGCPMHKVAPKKNASAQLQPQSQAPSSCPVSSSASSPSTGASSCPVASSSGKPAHPISSSSSPIESTSSSTSSSAMSRLNPLNYMPNLSQSQSPNQRSHLNTSRTISSIPRGELADADGDEFAEGESNTYWQYPSPQQMYNALRRKGYDDTPEDAMDSMVAVHNFLNEGAWTEIIGWEARFTKGLMDGWKVCGLGEEEGQKELERRGALGQLFENEGRTGTTEPRLSRFMGRPGEMTPKARMLEIMGTMWPTKFAGEPPFDRHDWFVQRSLPNGERKEIRYVIDYYSGPPEPTGEPVFYLDVRPAIDGPTAACERLMRWGGDVWYRASGGKVRQNQNQNPQSQGVTAALASS